MIEISVSLVILIKEKTEKNNLRWLLITRRWHRKMQARLRNFAMKNRAPIFFAALILLAVIAVSTTGQSRLSAYRIQPVDETKKWSYPYNANEERSRQILKAAKLADNFYLTIQDVIKQLGKPDVVEDVRKKFNGLSPEEDRMMERNRNKLNFRAIWYISKQGTVPNLKDSWIAVYVGRDEKNIMELLANNIRD
jgi:hypothetical protein